MRPSIRFFENRGAANAVIAYHRLVNVSLSELAGYVIIVRTTPNGQEQVLHQDNLFRDDTFSLRDARPMVNP